MVSSYERQQASAGQLAPNTLHPYSHLQRHHHGARYGRPGASTCLPYRTHDLVFTSLRLVVYQIEPNSATPIASLLRDELSDAEIFTLIDDAYQAHSEWDLDRTASTFPGSSRSTNKSDGFARCVALREKMNGARVKHAERLRDDGMIDVDIAYKCERYEVELLRSDKEQLEALNARPYHMYPFKTREKEMVLSLIATPEALAEVYPPERCERLGITIKANTAPAPLEIVECEMTETDRGSSARNLETLFPVGPYWQPERSGETANETINRALEGLAGRRRSATFEQLLRDVSTSGNLQRQQTILTGDVAAKPLITETGDVHSRRLDNTGVKIGVFDNAWWQPIRRRRAPRNIDMESKAATLGHEPGQQLFPTTIVMDRGTTRNGIESDPVDSLCDFTTDNEGSARSHVPSRRGLRSDAEQMPTPQLPTTIDPSMRTNDKGEIGTISDLQDRRRPATMVSFEDVVARNDSHSNQASRRATARQQPIDQSSVAPHPKDCVALANVSLVGGYAEEDMSLTNELFPGYVDQIATEATHEGVQPGMVNLLVLETTEQPRSGHTRTELLEHSRVDEAEQFGPNVEFPLRNETRAGGCPQPDPRRDIKVSASEQVAVDSVTETKELVLEAYIA